MVQLAIDEARGSDSIGADRARKARGPSGAVPTLRRSLALIVLAAAPAMAAESRPLPAEQCRSLSAEFAQAIGREPTLKVAEPGAAKLPYADNIPKGQACVFIAMAKDRKAAARAGDALAAWVIRLRRQGWDDDEETTAEGGDDAQTGMRKGAQRFAFAVGQRPGAGGWMFRAVAYER